MPVGQAVTPTMRRGATGSATATEPPVDGAAPTLADDTAAAGAAERWSDAIATARDQLDGDIARGARASVQLTSLRALWRACHLQFVDIHHQVVRTCEELARVSTTLGGVLDAVKQVDG